MTPPVRPDGDPPNRPDAIDPAAGRAFAAQFRAFLSWVHDEDTTGEQLNDVVALVRGHLKVDGSVASVVERQWSPFEHVNVQTALDAWQTQAGRQVGVHGVVAPPRFGDVDLQGIITGHGLPPVALAAPSFADLPNGPGTTLACLTLALLLVSDERGSYVLLVSGPSDHSPSVSVQVAGLPVAQAQQLLSELDELRSRLNVYRGHLVEVSAGMSLTFAAVPSTERADVVLPEPVLARVEAHALGVAAHRAELLALGQHLKRGLLLYGPPGTGKTHTTRYLMARMTDYTRLMLSGRALHVVGSITELARELQPAVVVLEDVDLVAEDRSFGPSGNPVLFDLLDAMDGAAPDADLLFLLTTNRADLLEPALAARPGRVDVAVEIERPDAEARRRLFLLYGRAVPLTLSEADIDAVVERTDGVTASFLKELVRRAVLVALAGVGPRPDTAPLATVAPLAEVSQAHVDQALDELLDSTQDVTRTLLGVGVDPKDLPAGALAGEARPGLAPHSRRGRRGGTGWVSYGG